MNNFMTGMMQNVKPETEGKTCPMCHFDINKIRKLGKVGCAMCYEVFENELEPVLKQMNIRKDDKPKSDDVKPNKIAVLQEKLKQDEQSANTES